LVLSEIKDGSHPSLLAVRLLAAYFSSPKQEQILITLKQQLTSGFNNQTLQLVGGIIHYNEQNYEEALRILHQSSHIEAISLTLQIYLAMGRVDLAEKELKSMQKIDDDATITQLAAAWVNISLGGPKCQEACYIFQELAAKYTWTPRLLNGQAISYLHLRKFKEAEQLLMEALEKNPRDPETLINVIVCNQLLGKPQEVISRHLSQVAAIAPRHAWVQALNSFEDNFESSAARFQVS